MNRKAIPLVATAFGLLFIPCLLCLGQEASDANSFLEWARKHEFQSGKKDEKLFELREKPIMVWTNPAMYDQKGAIFAWMKEGRPLVFGTLFNSVHAGVPRSSMELLSLSDSEVVGRVDGNVIWNPTESGLKWFRFDGVAEIAQTSQRRLLQMRQISREFGSSLTEKDGSKLSLRLMPTPIMTYEPKNEATTEGAIFAFAATGTDPDVILVIENRIEDGKNSIHYAFARFHFRELSATKGNEEIWTVEPKEMMTSNFLGGKMFRDSPYVFIRVK